MPDVTVDVYATINWVPRQLYRFLIQVCIYYCATETFFFPVE